MPAKISVLLIEDDLEGAELIQRSFRKVSEEMFEVHHVNRFRDAIKRMQYITRRFVDQTDATQLKRLDDLGEIVRQATKEIGSSVQSLGQTKLTSDQMSIVNKIKKSSEESMNAVELTCLTQLNLSKKNLTRVINDSPADQIYLGSSIKAKQC